VAEPAVRFRGITRRFPGVLALDDVSLDVAAGSCHALGWRASYAARSDG